MANAALRPFIYADIDLNAIDGSAIWVTSIVETLAQSEDIQPVLLLKRPVIRDTLIKTMQRLDNVTIINPWSKEFKELELPLEDASFERNKRLTPRQAAHIIDHLDRMNYYDMFIIRGFPLSKEIAYNYYFANRSWFYITDFPQNPEEVTESDLEDLRTIFHNSAKLACQTPVLIDYFKELLKESRNDPFIYLPPMIPNMDGSKQSFVNRNNRLVYAGKFAPLWKIPDMFTVFNEVEDPSLQFIVAGDKFHNDPPQENYQENVESALLSSDRIMWKKGLTRQEVQQLIRDADVGISWRDEALDDSKELSTKVLEYGLYGKPVIMNRNALHEELFGADYPLFANSEEEFKDKIRLALYDQQAYEQAAKKVHTVSQNHTFYQIHKYLRPYLPMPEHYETSNMADLDRKIRLVFAGHDLKFAKMMIDYFQYHPFFEVRLDQWKSHSNHDEEHSHTLLDWADVIVAEWGLGNALWYSTHKRKNQILIVRMHLQEKNTPYPKQIKWKHVDQLIYIAPGLRRDFETLFGFLPSEKSTVIFNLVDADQLNREKLPGSEFNLGFMGMAPSRKRLDIAIDIFEKLWHRDSRYTLHIKGKLPNDYAWLWKRPEEKDYFIQLFKRINQSPWRNSVIFDGWGNDVFDWFRKIGFVLSTSDFESFHLSVAEGMASGTIPLIRDWEGANELYPHKFIIHTVDDGVQLIEDAKISSSHFISLQDEVQNYIQNKFDKKVICKQWEELIVTQYKSKTIMPAT